METDKRLSFLISLGYFAAAAALGFLALRLIPWFWPFLASLVLAYTFKSLARRFRASTRAAAAAAGVLFYCAVALLFWLLTVLAISGVVELSTRLPEFYLQSLLPYAERLSGRVLALLHRFAPASAISLGELFELLSAAAQELVTELSSFSLSLVTGFFKRLPTLLIGFVFMIISSFAIAMDYDRVTQFLMRQLPHSVRPLTLDIRNFLISCLFKLFKAYAIIMLITFLELCVGLWALRVASFWKYAAAIAVMDILPLLGSGAVLIPWSIFELINGRTALGLGLLALYAVVAVMRNIIEPHVVGDSLGLHPAVTLAAMFFGLSAFGITGMLAAPTAALLVRFLNENGKIRLYK